MCDNVIPAPRTHNLRHVRLTEAITDVVLDFCDGHDMTIVDILGCLEAAKIKFTKDYLD